MCMTTGWDWWFQARAIRDLDALRAFHSEADSFSFQFALFGGFIYWKTQIKGALELKINESYSKQCSPNES